MINIKSIIPIIAVFCLIFSSCTRENEYQLVWSDEFDYNGLPDSTIWNYDTRGNAWGWGNNELQMYTTKREKNAVVKEGSLFITAEKEPKDTFNYTSARLTTKGKGDWLYGRFEIKAKVPGGVGLWPAIWMLPTESKYGGWPRSGEIDIMEHVGYQPENVFFTVHTESFNHRIGTEKSQKINLPMFEETFHVFTLEWTPDSCVFFMDEAHAFTFVKASNDSKEWPFDQAFHLLLNVAVGGDWGGVEGVDDHVFPKQIEVDYVRVYQKKN